MEGTRQRLEAILRERIAVLDGSWGVLIQRELRGEDAYRGEPFRDHPRDVAGDPDLLNITRPEVVARIHDEYFAAGADIATTNTFTATTIGQSDYALEDAVYEMNLEGARLARRAADGWTAKTPAKAFWVSVEHAQPLVVGVNCSLGAADMRPFVEDLSQLATTWVSCYPNAGLPNEFGAYDEQPHDTSGVLGQFARDGLVNIVGGCCGTTPEHVRAIVAAVEGVPPLRVPEA